MAKKYDIFISYRRKGGVQDARLVNEKLLNSGYSVSFDIDTLGRGKFTDTLNTRLKDCKDFVVIFERSYYERFYVDKDTCTMVQSDEVLNQDWCYLELKSALEMGKNIIPLVPKDFVFPNNLPAGVREVAEMNAIQLTEKEFKEIFEYKFKNYLLSKPSFTYRHKKSIIGILSLIILAIVAFLVNQTMETQRLAKEEKIRLEAHLNQQIALEKERQAFVADSIRKLGEQGVQAVLDSIKAKEKAEAERRAAAAANAPAQTSGNNSGGFFWVGNGDDTGNIIRNKLSRIGLKSGACSGNGIKVVLQSKPSCRPNSMGFVKCAFQPVISAQNCDGSQLQKLTYSQTFNGSNKDEALSRGKMIEDLQGANFSNWVSSLQGLKR